MNSAKYKIMVNLTHSAPFTLKNKVTLRRKMRAECGNRIKATP